MTEINRCPFHRDVGKDGLLEEVRLPPHEELGNEAEPLRKADSAYAKTLADFFAGARSDNPYLMYEELRKDGDVVPLSQVSRRGNLYSVLGFDAAKQVLSDSTTFPASKPDREQVSTSTGRSPHLLQHMTEEWMVHHDGQHHQKLRNLFGDPLTAPAVKEGSLTLSRICGDVLDAALKTGDEFCLMEHVARLFPLRVLLDRYQWQGLEKLLSVKEVATVAYGTASSGISYDTRKAATKILKEKYQEFEEILTAADGGKRLIEDARQHNVSQEMLIANAWFYLVAGHETTSSLIGTMVQVFIHQPDVWKQLKSDWSLIGQMVSEALRYEAPIQMTPRHVSRPCRLGDVELLPGDLLLVVIGAANRDPQQFGASAGQFMLSRKMGPGLSFGGGLHLCHGIHLAMEEGKVFLREALRRIERFEEVPGSPPERTRDTTFRGFSSFPIRAILPAPQVS